MGLVHHNPARVRLCADHEHFWISSESLGTTTRSTPDTDLADAVLGYLLICFSARADSVLVRP